MQRRIFYSKRCDLVVLCVVTLLFTAVCVGVLALPQASADGAKNGLDYSFGVLIPSLFPFMFLSSFSVEYGISDKVGRVLAPFTEKLLYLPSEAGVTFLLSLVGGFPVGAVGINTLYKQGKISSSQAQRMLCCCVNSGPAFLISVVGIGLYHSEPVGIILFAAQLITSVAIGIVMGVLARLRKEPLQRSPVGAYHKNDFAKAFVTSASSTCTAALNLCALVVLFSAFSSLLLNVLGIDEASSLSAVIRAFLEVTDGCGSLAKLNAPIYMIALAVGWSGICVHFQVFAAADALRINKLSFYISRVVSGVTAALITFVAGLFITLDKEVFSNFTESSPTFSSSTFYGSLALLISSILFLIFLNTYIKSGVSPCENEALAQSTTPLS